MDIALARAKVSIVDGWEVLAEPRRRRLLASCLEAERSVSELHAAMPDVTLGAVSQHLGRLRAARLVTVRTDGRRRLYRADPARLAEVRRGLDAMWVASLDRLAALAGDEARRDDRASHPGVRGAGQSPDEGRASRPGVRSTGRSREEES